MADILHIIDSISVGGVETWLNNVFREDQSRNKHEVLCVGRCQKASHATKFPSEIVVHYIEFDRYNLLKFSIRFRRLLRQEKYDVIHDHQGIYAGWRFILGAGLLPPILIVHAHNATHQRSNSSYLSKLGLIISEIGVSRNATLIAGTSESLLRSDGYYSSRFDHIPKKALYCGIETSLYEMDTKSARANLRGILDVPESARIVLVVGRADKRSAKGDGRIIKNTEFAVRVAMKCAKADPRVHVLFLGEESDLTDEAQALIADAGLSQRIRFLGIVDGVEQWLCGSDALMFPSIQEGLGLVAVEAQAAGIPTLLSYPIPTECIVNSNLIKRKDLADGEESWAKALLLLMENFKRDENAHLIIKNSCFAIKNSVRALDREYHVQKRVLEIIGVLSMGGVETWLLEFLRESAVAKPEVSFEFLIVNGKPNVLDEEIKLAGGKIYYLIFSRGSVIEFIIKFRRLLRFRRYAAIHDHQGHNAGWHFLAATGMLPPIRITHVHNPTIEWSTLKGARLVAGKMSFLLAAFFSSAILGTSKQILSQQGFNSRFFRHIPRGALYCGIDTRRFKRDEASDRVELRQKHAIPDNARIIIVVGRIDSSAKIGDLSNHKNTAFAVEVAIAVSRMRSDVYTLFIGELSPAVAVLSDRLKRAGFHDRIKFIGIQKKIEMYMGGADLLLFPSISEGLGMVAVEAQAAGLPVLAGKGVPSECAVVPDLVHFKDISDGVMSWASEVSFILDAKHYKSEANEKVAQSQFSIEISSRRLYEAYRV